MSLNKLRSKTTFKVSELVTTEDATIKLNGPNVEIGETCFPSGQGNPGQILTVGVTSDCGVWEDPIEQLPKTNIPGKYLKSTVQEGQPEWADLDVSATQNITATPGITNITGQTNTDQLQFKAQDNSTINLNPADRGNAGYFLATDGLGDTYWQPDGAGAAGITQTAVPAPTTALNKLTVYNSNDGLTVKDSNVQYISGIGLNMNQEGVANASQISTNQLNAVNPATEISVNNNLDMGSNEILSDVTIGLNAGTSTDIKVASNSKLEVTDTAINAKTVLKASDIQEYVVGQGVNVDGVKIQDTRLINSSSSQDLLRLDSGGVFLQSTGGLDLNCNSVNEMNLRLSGVRKINIQDTETSINNELKVDTIKENTLDNGVNVDGLQIKDERITNISDPSSNLRLDSNGVLLRSGGAMDLDANGIGYEMNLRLNGDRKINIQTNETSINNNLKVDNILENTPNNGVNIDGINLKDTSLINSSSSNDTISLAAGAVTVNSSDVLNLNTESGAVRLSPGGNPQVIVDSSNTTLDNNLKVANIVERSNGSGVNVEGSQFRTGGLATINELTVLDAIDVSDNVISNVGDGVSSTDAVNKSQLDTKINLTEKGAVSGVCPLDNQTPQPKIPSQYIPNLAITDTYVVADTVARDAIAVVQQGDIAIVQNPANNWIWTGPEGPPTSSGTPPDYDWVKLVVPTGTVTSVNTFTGTVTLGTNDIAETGTTNRYYTPTKEQEVLLRDGTQSMLANLSMNGNNQITDLPLPLFSHNATNKSYVDSRDNLKLNLTGGTMTGPINMVGNAIQTTHVPVTTSDLTNKSYVDDGNTTRLKTNGSIVMTGSLNLGGNDLLNTNEINIASIKQLNPANDILCESLDFQQTGIIKNVPQIQTASLSIVNPAAPVTAYTPYATSENTPVPYVYTASSIGTDPARAGWKAFHTIGTFEVWQTNNGLYDGITGNYVGSVSTSLDGGSLLGEWAQIDTVIPHTIDAYKAVLKPLAFDPYGIISWTICGSNDGINFTSIDSQTDYVSVGGNPPPIYTFNTTTSPAYRFFRMIATKKEPNASFTGVALQGLQFNITPAGSVVSVDIQGDLDVSDKIVCDDYESFAGSDININPSAGQKVNVSSNLDLLDNNITNVNTVQGSSGNPLYISSDTNIDLNTSNVNIVSADIPKQTSQSAPYEVIASSQSAINPARQPWKAFQQFAVGPDESWQSENGKYNATGDYIGPERTLDSTGGFFDGEWIQIKLNDSLLLDNYSFVGNVLALSPYGPRDFSLYGSNDGCIFTLLNAQVAQTFTVNVAISYPVTPVAPFRIYRLVINKKIADPTFTGVALTGITLTGKLYKDVAVQKTLDVATNLFVNSIAQDTGKDYFGRRSKNYPMIPLPTVGPGRTSYAATGTSVILLEMNDQLNFNTNPNNFQHCAINAPVSGFYKIDFTVDAGADNDACVCEFELRIGGVVKKTCTFMKMKDRVLGLGISSVEQALTDQIIEIYVRVDSNTLYVYNYNMVVRRLRNNN